MKLERCKRSLLACFTEVGFLKDLPGASERLSIFEADLSRPQSFEAAIEGCVGVFLVAHPTNDDVETKHSIIGTLNILQMCVDLKTVKRVVYTSSAASAMFENKKSGHIIVNESCWSDLDHIHEIAPSVAEYTIAKTTTEKSAFEFAELHGLDLVTVLPAWIHGPFLGTRCPSSVYTLMAMFFGMSSCHSKYIIYCLGENIFNIFIVCIFFLS